MAFTTINGKRAGAPEIDPTLKNVVLDNSVGELTGGPWEPYFHLEDIARVIDQPGTTHVLMLRAKVGSLRTDCYVLIGASIPNGEYPFDPPIGPNAQVKRDFWLAEPHHIAAGSCPPGNKPTGVLLDDNTKSERDLVYAARFGISETEFDDRVDFLVSADGF